SAAAYHGHMGGEFRYVNPPRIVWGAHAIERLTGILDDLGVRRPFIVSTRSVMSNPHLMQRLIKAAGRELAGVSSPIGQHAPQQDLDQAIACARQAAPDGVVSFGGGSPIDAAKIVTLELGNMPHV